MGFQLGIINIFICVFTTPWVYKLSGSFPYSKPAMCIFHKTEYMHSHGSNFRLQWREAYDIKEGPSYTKIT